MAEQLKQSKINGNITGILEEKALELETGVEKEKDGKKYKTDVIKGKLVVNGYEIRVYSQSKNGDKENKMFKGLLTIYNDYLDKVEASKTGGVADTISVSIRYECNDYVGQDDTVKTGTQISLFKADRVSPETPHQAEIDLDNVYIASMMPEVKDEEETGRLKIKLAYVDYYGKIKPLEFFVENSEDDDLVGDIENYYEVGQTVHVYAELKQIRIGGETSKGKAGFGRKANVASGFTITEAHIIGGEEPFEDELAYDTDEIKKAMKERQLELDEMVAKAKEKAKQGGATGGLKGSGSKGGAVGKKANVAKQTEEDDSLPF